MSTGYKMAATSFAVVFLLVLDRYLKFLALAGISRPLLAGWLDFGLSRNYGIAFSLPLYGWPVRLLTGLVILGLVFLAIRACKQEKTAELAAYGLIIAGAASNLYDRLYHGYVVDYWEVAYFSVLNLADVMIFLGVVGLIWLKRR